MKGLFEIILRGIDELLEQYRELRIQSGHTRDWSRVSVADASQFIAGAMATIRRVAGDQSQFQIPASKALEGVLPAYISEAVPYVAGSLQALRDAVESGYLVTLEELIHADVFGDFLEMAEYLLKDGYKDPAAVLIGGVLEGHLRKLCAKNNIPLEFVDSRGKSRPKSVERMNTELAKARVYSKTDQKNVTAWYGLRTDAAHGHYKRYTQKQVRLMLDGVRNFVVQHPA